MLLLDVNILVGAQRNDASTDARPLRVWLTEALNGHETIGITEQVLASMVRIVTHPRVFGVPSTPAEAIQFADAVLAAPTSMVVRPAARHWSIFERLVTEQRLRGSDVPDAYLAALALEAGATFVTRDAGFARFASLRVLDPLAA